MPLRFAPRRLVFTPALALLAAAGFGTTAQTLPSLASLQDSSARLG